MSSGKRESGRNNRAVGLAEALGGVLDPALKKRGFANRDIITQWAAIAPAPYDRVTAPDKLVWRRGTDTPEGAVLHLRCDPAHRLALAHEGERVAAAVNRYFGYVLVAEVRLSPMPFEPPVPQAVRPTEPGEVVRAKVGRTVGAIEDVGLREALAKLGRALMGRSRG